MPELILSPSLLAADFSKLADECKRVEGCGARWLHLDIMDGHFVPNISFGPPVVAALRGKTDLFFDVHLMLEHPKAFVASFAKSGADLICFHQEAADDIGETIAAIHKAGCKCGLSVKPDTQAEALLPYLDQIELLLVMTVEPGFGGQSFLERCMPKLAFLAAERKKRGLSFRLEVDGGINAATGKIARENGADTLVAGTYLFHANDMKAAADALRA